MAKSTLRVVAHVVALPGKEEQMKAVLLELVEPSRKEEGCISYELLQNPVVPTQFVFIEEWENEAAVNAHMSSDHVEEAFQEGAELLASPPDIHHYKLLA